MGVSDIRPLQHSRYPLNVPWQRAWLHYVCLSENEKDRGRLASLFVNPSLGSTYRSWTVIIAATHHWPTLIWNVIKTTFKHGNTKQRGSWFVLVRICTATRWFQWNWFVNWLMRWLRYGGFVKGGWEGTQLSHIHHIHSGETWKV